MHTCIVCVIVMNYGSVKQWNDVVATSGVHKKEKSATYVLFFVAIVVVEIVSI